MGTDIAECSAGTSGAAKYVVLPHPGRDHPLPSEFAELVLRFESATGYPLWLLCQNGASAEYDLIGEEIADAFLMARRGMGGPSPVAVLVDSPGGQAKHAYRAARVINKHGGFVAVVPRSAKSAATLLSLGAERIILGEFAELGPLDVQIWDPERERSGSALDEVQSLERLHAASMAALDQVMFLLVPRMRKRTDVLLPMVLDFISGMMSPLLDKIDAVHYTEVSRWLKEGEEYAVRCLRLANYPDDVAKDIASRLVNRYPVHDFLIGVEEAEEIGLRVTQPAGEIADIMDQMVPFLRTMSAVGVMRRADHDERDGETEADAAQDGDGGAEGEDTQNPGTGEHSCCG